MVSKKYNLHRSILTRIKQTRTQRVKHLKTLLFLLKLENVSKNFLSNCIIGVFPLHNVVYLRG